MPPDFRRYFYKTMWGNFQGWIISLLLVIAMVAGIAYLGQLDRTTPPTSLTTDARNLATLTLATPAITALGGMDLTGDTTAADATTDFKSAIDAYLADSSTYDRAAQGTIAADFDQLPAIAPLLRAVAFKEAPPVLAPMADDVITFKSERPPLDAIVALGNTLIAAALNDEASNREAARRYYSAAFQLGDDLFNERIVYGELTAGNSLMTASSSRLLKLAGDDVSVKAAFKQFDSARRDLLQQRVALLWPAIATIDSNVIRQHIGDVFVLVRQRNERLWRVESCFALARFRFAALRPRDRAASQRTLADIADSEKDLIVRTAAREARKMTLEDYRMLR